MEKLIEITNEEFHKIVGAVKLPEKKFLETIKVFLPNVDDILGSKDLERQSLIEKICSYENFVHGSNAFILSSDLNENKEPFFDSLFGMTPSHTCKYEITSVKINDGAYCKI